MDLEYNLISLQKKKKGYKGAITNTAVCRRDVVRGTSNIASEFQTLGKEVWSRGLSECKCMLLSINQSHHESLGPIFTVGDYEFNTFGS